MADNYLERHREDYEARKKEWERRRRHLPNHGNTANIPDDETL